MNCIPLIIVINHASTRPLDFGENKNHAASLPDKNCIHRACFAIRAFHLQFQWALASRENVVNMPPPTPTKKGTAEKKKNVPKGQLLMSQFLRKVAPPQVHILEGSNDISELFSSYEIQKGVYLAPKLRVCPASPSSLRKLLNQDKEATNLEKEASYISELKKRPTRTSPATCTRKNGDAEDTELVSSTPPPPKKTQNRMKVKLIQFSENTRPAYYGTMRRKSKCIRPRNPFVADTDLLDYEVDSDDEWVEEQAAENVEEVDNDEESEDEEDEEDEDGFIEDDENELNSSRGVDMTEEDDELKPIRPSVESWLKQRKIVRLKKRVVGPFWRDQEDQCPSILKKLALIRIADTSRNKDKNNNENDASSLSKSFGKNKIPESLMPFLIQLTHGSTAAVAKIAKTFLELLDIRDSSELTTKFSSVDISVLEVINNTPREKIIKKNTVINIIKQVASWTEPSMMEKTQKRCWYIREEVRQYYKVLEGLCLPNPTAFMPPTMERVKSPPGTKRKISPGPNVLSEGENRLKQSRIESPEILPGFKHLLDAEIQVL